MTDQKTPAERVELFLRAFESAGSNDPELIYRINGYELRVSDLRALLDTILKREK